MKKTYTAISIFLFLAAVSSCSVQKDSVYRKSLPLMDTVVSITIVCGSKDTAEKALEEAFERIQRFGNRINFYSETSELSEINRSAGVRKIRVSPETLDVIEKAVLASERSSGAFDPTLGPVVKLWDFAEKRMPSVKEVDLALRLVSYRDIIIDRNDSSVMLRKKGMLIDLGGIAKGYAADMAVESLMHQGIQSGLVSIAGDIRTFGLKPDKEPWTIGIKNPRQTGAKDEIIAKARLTGRAISTSGDYERYFIADGKRYHHLLDPKTGFPAGLCRSVSIVAEKAVDTDAFSTAVFVLGPDRGIKLVQDLGMDALIIDSRGAMHMTDGMKEKVSVEKGI